MKRLRLAIVTPGFPASEQDTACTPALADYVLGLQSYAPNVDLEVFALSYPFDRNHYRWHGIPIYSSGRAKSGRTDRVMARWRLWRAMIKAERDRGGFDAVHSFWLGSSASLAQAFARRRGSRHVVTLMGQEIRLSLRYRQLLLRRDISAVAIGSHQAASVANRVPDVRLGVIPFGLDPLPTATVPPHCRNYDLAFVGSLTEVKRPLDFIEIIAKLDPNLTAVMVGDGPLRAAVESRISELDLSKRVKLCGHLNREDALQQLAQARVLVHTSAFEGGPSVLDEALALGVAVAIGPVGKAEDGPGCIVASGPDDMRIAVERLLAEPPPAARINHPVQETVRQYLALYGLERGMGRAIQQG
jgi:1,2-diacylglycerol 3-alpha-glucosyltransferase